jgi:hypothetical protein
LADGAASLAQVRTNGACEGQFSGSPEHVPKKLLDFFDQDMLQLIDIERFLFDHMIPCDRETLCDALARPGFVTIVARVFHPPRVLHGG